MGVFIGLVMIIICICISNHFVHLKYIQFLFEVQGQLYLTTVKKKNVIIKNPKGGGQMKTKKYGKASWEKHKNCLSVKSAFTNVYVHFHFMLANCSRCYFCCLFYCPQISYFFMAVITMVNLYLEFKEYHTLYMHYL